MGMDLDTFMLVRPIEDDGNQDSIPSSRTIYFTEKQKLFLESLFGNIHAVQEEYVDYAEIMETNQIDSTEYQPTNWDFTEATGWLSLSAEGKPDILLEVESSKFLQKSPHYHAVFEVLRLGYMRKPFRIKSSIPVTNKDGSTSLSTDDWEGADIASIKNIMGEAFDEGYMLFTIEDIDLLRKLAPLSCGYGNFIRQTVGKMASPQVVSIINW